MWVGINPEAFVCDVWGRLTIYVTDSEASVDKVREQGKLEAWEMPENATDSSLSSACNVSPLPQKD